MKKLHTPQPSVFKIVLKELSIAFNSFFKSNENCEFKRLKNFVAQ